MQEEPKRKEQEMKEALPKKILEGEQEMEADQLLNFLEEEQ